MTVKERIIEQAIELFFRSGIKAITMDDISKESGVSKRTIYELFRDKDDLIRRCLSAIDEGYNVQHIRVVEESSNIIHVVFGLMKLGVAAIRQMNPLFFDDLKKYHNKVWKDVYRMNMEKQHNQILMILKKGINQGYFRREIDTEIVTVLLMHQLRIMSEKTVFTLDKFSQIRVFENVMIMFLRGISTTKGLDIVDKLLIEEPDFFHI